jgi:hypothetical protein
VVRAETKRDQVSYTSANQATVCTSTAPFSATSGLPSATISNCFNLSSAPQVRSRLHESRLDPLRYNRFVLHRHGIMHWVPRKRLERICEPFPYQHSHTRACRSSVSYWIICLCRRLLVRGVWVSSGCCCQVYTTDPIYLPVMEATAYSGAHGNSLHDA